jgi:hypothetical protein
MQACKDWAVGTYSSDWMSPEIGSHNLAGYDPRTGTGHARFAGTRVNGTIYKEMIRGKTTSLTAGVTYNVSFWVKRIDGTTDMRVGAYLSSTIPSIHDVYTDPYVQNFFPQIENVVPGENSEYMKISGCFTPTTNGLHYITIGVFDVYPEAQGTELNFFNVDDVDIEVSSGPNPTASFTLGNEFCPADDIIADATASTNYDSYQWQILSNTGEILYASDFESGVATAFDVRDALYLTIGECYKVKLILQGNCNSEISKSFCITSSFINLATDDGPFCEGESIAITTDGQSDWNYNWSNGETGTGLSAINPIAALSTSSYSVTAASPAGCSVNGNVSVLVHPSPNVAPELLPTNFTYYVNPQEQVQFTVYSTDHPNEKVFLSNSNLPGIATFVPLGSQHQYGTFTWTPTEVDYGAHNFTITLTDNNECGALSKTYNFRVEVLCPLCPLCVSYEGNTPTNNPLPALTEAAKCIEAGLTEEVIVGDSPVEFVAGEYIELGDFFVEGEFFAQIEGTSCAEACNECCEDWTGFSYDTPPNVLTADGDGINDFWYLADVANPFCAFNALGYRIRVQNRWDNSWIYERSDYPGYCCPYTSYIDPVTGAALPTDISWDGTHQNGNLAVDGTYDIFIDLYGCSDSIFIEVEDVQLFGLAGKSQSNYSSDPEDSTIENNFIYKSIDQVNFSSELILEIYPSPANEKLNIVIQNSTDENKLIEIYNAQGKLCYTIKSSQNLTEIDVTTWSSGIYTVFLKHKNGIIQKKFAKI